MPHIPLPENVPGIRSLVMYRPDTGRHLYELVQVLLRGPSPLSPAHRELIAAYVSRLNDCRFCSSSHAAAARCLLGEEGGLVDRVLTESGLTSADPLLRSLLHIAARVQHSGSSVRPEDVDAARAAGATDAHIHDTVLIAATFCMFNRYVDGLATLTPDDEPTYAEMGRRMTTLGYTLPNPTN